MSVLDLDSTLALLRDGTLEVTGRLVDASNATLYGTVELDGETAACVYKPRAGERPLWDFPDGTLARREVAAYAVSAATGWQVVPPTVLREGPFGPGMCQLWIDVDDTVELVDVVPRGSLPKGWRRVLDASGPGGRPVILAHADDARLRRVAVLDAVINNGDRKGGHLLPTPEEHVFGIDHGVSFHVEDKLRTVLWGWAGKKLLDEERTVLSALLDDLGAAGPLATTLGELLSRRELAATTARVRTLLRKGVLPTPPADWPAIPWPPF